MNQSYRKTTPGEEVKRLLIACQGNEECLAYNIAKEPDHWVPMIAYAVPYLLLNRCTANDSHFWDIH